jgi:CheY-like chemotaxis protein
MWKILVVDDNFVDRKLVVEILRSKAECDIAANAKEAVEACNLAINEKRPYDCILLDIEMPDINGIEFLESIRDIEEAAGIPLGKGIPIVMVTAHKEDFIKAFKKGCDDYVLKPISAQTLIAKINQVVNNK